MTDAYARLDFRRRERIGMVEAVWGEHKSVEQIAAILKMFQSRNQMALVTRVSSQKAEIVLESIQEATYHVEANCLTVGDPLPKESSLGRVVVVSGGTSDLQVAKESQLALECHGIETDLLLDVGVAGLHRLLENLNYLKEAKVLIVCAGMEGALPTVISGLLPQPIVGVPISVGYGMSSKGKAALAGMLSSCSPGLVVVNIDNGYGAAMAALRIIKIQKH
ncbi:nickel pincer cofactor biosynthesis protein LarB [Prochlorococcus sp. MIT 1300]|uniref:nickel pincer cofactor biosynthesis protein LarB n=1 Tax=Prochlorococcus sp. MIT 1300 TaxID=3096218 RepID=UPI002A759EB2|nr:nickel pincer cofactor biosynthesis protein LarB [Prochlorococcus sp. MIT 1300]